MSAARHPIFDQFPLTGEVSLSTGSAPRPYHVYDGHGLLVVGDCEPAALADAFAGQDVYPVLTRSGRGVLVIFVCDFTQSSHQPHHELHITALAAPTPAQVIPDDPAAALVALARQADWGVLSLHLWNDTAEVVAYNSEYLGLQAARATSHIAIAEGWMKFDFAAAEGGPLARGGVRRNKRSDGGLMLRVLRQLGWRGLWDAMRKRPARAHVINRKCDRISHNGRAKTLTAPDTMIVTAFDPERDSFDLSAGPCAGYAFTPRVIEHLSPFRFVYLHPDESGA